MPEKKIIAPDNVWDSRPELYYAQATRSGNMIFISGQTAWDENMNIVGRGDIEAQTRQIFENIKRILESEGAKMSDIVKMNFFCRDIRFLRRGELFAKVLKEYFGPVCPACTGVQISNLWNPDFMLEIEAIAMVD